MISLDDVLARLEEVTGVAPRANAKGHLARCPAHDDGTPSLSVATGDTGILFNCHASCDVKAIASALGYELRDLFFESPKRPARDSRGTLQAAYDYRGEDGAVLFQSCRYALGSKKTFRLRRPDGEGDWIWKMDGVRRVPYRLPELIAGVKAGSPVFVAEGEKCVDALVGVGLVATTNSEGAGKWRPEFARYFEGATVAVLPDNDEPGRKHAVEVAQSIVGVADTVCVVDLPGLGPKGDVFDWLALGGTAGELLTLAGKAPSFTSGTTSSTPPPAGGATTSTTDVLVPDEYAFTDHGNARRLARLHGADLRYCHPWAAWLVWTGTCWKPDQTGEVMRRAKDSVQRMYAEAALIDEKKEREALLAWAKKSNSAWSLRAAVQLAASEPGIPVLPDELDADAMLLNVRNGTVDLSTQQVRPHRREDLITKVAGVSFDASAVASRWRAFLEEMQPDDDTRGFLQRVAGYLATGSTKEQCFFLAHGEGNNGKSIVLGIWHRLLGDYSVVIPKSLVIATRNDPHPTERALLYRARLAMRPELPRGVRLAEDKMKELCSEDPIEARRMNENWWSFLPTAKVVIASNHLPTIEGTDLGIWRRNRTMRFPVTIPKERIDRDLMVKLLPELPGILNWMLAGTAAWLRDGLQVPAAVVDATSEYREQQDVIGGFLSSCCNLAPGATVPKGAVRMAYVAWCRLNEEDPMTDAALRARLLERPGVGEDRSKAARSWTGLMLTTEGEKLKQAEERHRAEEKERRRAG